MTEIIGFAGILITGLIAIFGYLYASHATRREHIAHSLTEALNAVGDYQDLPYRVRRRPAANAPTRAALADKISNIHSRMDFHLAWLQITAPTIAEAYERLVYAARKEAGAHIKAAWRQPLITNDEGMNLGLGAIYQCPQTETTRVECLYQMRRFLGKLTERIGEHLSSDPLASTREFTRV
jgi:hypothetical protein